MTKTVPAHSTDAHDWLQHYWPCLTGEAIANRPEFQAMGIELKSLISAPATTYTNLYETTLHQFMAFCQAMPQDLQKPKPYSLLSTALDTAIAALKLRRGEMMPRHSNSETIAEKEPLWTYAVFSASLWAHLPDLRMDRTIKLYKREQEPIGLWHPIAGCLYEPDMLYRILLEPHPTTIDRVGYLAGTMGKIIPPIGCRWLSSDEAVWLAWWEVITQTPNDHNVIWQLINKNLTKPESIALPKSPPPVPSAEDDETGLIEAEPESSESVKKAISETEVDSTAAQAVADLNQWILRHCSSSGILNGHKMFARIKAGVLIRLKSLTCFIQEHPHYGSVELFLKHLEPSLKKEINQTVIFRYHLIHGKTEKVVRGIILPNQFLCDTLNAVTADNQFIRDLS